MSNGDWNEKVRAPKNRQLDSEYFARFLPLRCYLDDCNELKFAQADHESVEFEILTNPKGAPFVAGCNGLRQMRVELSSSGAVRRAFVQYLWIAEASLCVLCAASASDDRTSLDSNHKTVIDQVIRDLRRGTGRQF